MDNLEHIPLITLGITAFNAEATIQRAIESAINQTWTNIEIVIVDDCSIDNTFDIISSLAKRSPLITTIKHNKENRGVAYTRNRILDNAQGDFIAFFDDDDISVPDRIEQQYKRITEFAKAYAPDSPIICYTARKQIYPNREVHIEATTGVNDHTVPHGRDVAHTILTGGPIREDFGSMATCSQMIPTNFLRALEGFDENFVRSEDTELNIRAALAGAYFVGIPVPTVIQTMTLSSDKPLTIERTSFQMLLTKHSSTIKDIAPEPFCRKWIDMKYNFLEGKKILFIFDMIDLIIRHPALTIKRISWAASNIRLNILSHNFYQSRKK